jgi:hypothetical protein
MSRIILAARSAVQRGARGGVLRKRGGGDMKLSNKEASAMLCSLDALGKLLLCGLLLSPDCHARKLATPTIWDQNTHGLVPNKMPHPSLLLEHDALLLSAALVER